MTRSVGERKKRAALRKLRRTAQRVAEGAELSDWEKRFLEEVDGRVETYGAAFRDWQKGAPEEALSHLQQQKLREIDAKARGKARKGLTPKKGFRRALPARDSD
jgi:hypothetical protein